MCKQKLPLLLSSSISIEYVHLRTVEERRNDNVTIHELFIAPKDVLFKQKKDFLRAAFSRTSSYRVGMCALMFLLLRDQGGCLGGYEVYGCLQGRISTAYKGASHQPRLLLA